MDELLTGRNNETEVTLGAGVLALTEQPKWYALHTRPRHEKKVDIELQEKGVVTYLPLLTQVRRWSDRRKTIRVPLFSCYVFVRSILDSATRLRISTLWGALGLVGFNGHTLSIPDPQIESIRTLLASNVGVAPHPFLKAGQRVRVRGGALDGVEGILVANRTRRLVISIETISHSLSINLEGQDVEPV